MISFHAATLGIGKVLIIGDSNTEAMWWNNLSGCNTINAGMGGARIRDIATRAQAIAAATKPRHVHLMIGTNDVSLADGDPELATLQADTETIISAFQAYGSKVVVWPMPPFSSNWSTNLSRRDAINSALASAASSRGAYWDWYWPNTITQNGDLSNGTVTSGYAVSGALVGDGVHFSPSTQTSRYYRIETWRQYIKSQTGVDCN
jgi:lysophospholipase L1-like esterase